MYPSISSKVRRTQRRFLLAAHKEIHKDGEQLIETFNYKKDDKEAVSEKKEEEKQ